MLRLAGQTQQIQLGRFIPTATCPIPARNRGAVLLFSGVAERLQKRVEAADPNFDFASWLGTDDVAPARLEREGRSRSWCERTR